jgi:hypothetical protein
MQEAFKEFAEQMRALLVPEKYFSWQTLLMLSLFSWLVATGLYYYYVETGAVAAGVGIERDDPLIVEFISTLSWIFLTSAIWWAIDSNKDKFTVEGFYIGPWITGAVFCLFAFRPWEEYRFRWALSSWPLVSMAIMALPNFVNWELKFSVPKPDKRQMLLMTLLINLLLNSWILFSFRIQDWVANYPSLLVRPSGDNILRDSSFLYDFAPGRERQSQGVVLIESTANAIIGELNELPWYQTERWLYTRQERLEAIAQRVNSNLDAPDERIFWQMAVPQPRRLGEGYLLTLRADWTGPMEDRGFYAEKDCKITPEDRVRSVPNGSQTQRSQNQATGQTTEGAAGRTRVVAETSRVTKVDCGEEVAQLRWRE